MWLNSFKVCWAQLIYLFLKKCSFRQLRRTLDAAAPDGPPPSIYPTTPNCISLFSIIHRTKACALKALNYQCIFCIWRQIKDSRTDIQYTCVFQYRTTKCKVSPYSMPWRYRRGVVVQLHPVWASALKGGGCLMPRPHRFSTGKAAQEPLVLAQSHIREIKITFPVYFWRNSSPRPPGGQGPLIHEVSRSHTTAHHSRW